MPEVSGTEPPGAPLRPMSDTVRARRGQRLPVVLLPAETQRRYDMPWNGCTPTPIRSGGWQFVFPSTKLDEDGEGAVRRWHVPPTSLRKAIKLR